MRWLATIVLLILATAACGAIVPSATPTPTVLPGAEDLVKAALRDLADRIKVASADIRVKEVQAVEWPSTALGCPEPGMMYAQVITPGYKIVLTAGGRDYTYHSDRSRVVYCPDK